MNYLFLLLTLIITSSLSAQGMDEGYVGLNQELLKRGYEEEKTNAEELAGSPYWEDEFVAGEIKRNGKKEIEAYIRYNVLSDQIQIKVNPEKDEFYLLPRWGDLEYVADKYSYFLSHKITEDKKSLYGYFIKYFESKNIKFYGKPLAEILPAQRPETSYDQGRPATIKVKSHYYVQLGDEPLKEVRIKERDFRELFNNSKRMRIYFKENKVKKIEDVVKMLNFYEENI